MDDVATQFNDAWKQTKKNQDKKQTLALVTSFIDIASGVGSGGNAIVQFATKDTKAVFTKLGDLTNAMALRGGQVVDMAQAFANAGITLSSPPMSGAARDIVNGMEELEQNASTKLSTLNSTLIHWKDEWESSRYEGL